jgi:hypothetical protein
MYEHQGGFMRGFAALFESDVKGLGKVLFMV